MSKLGTDVRRCGPHIKDKTDFVVYNSGYNVNRMKFFVIVASATLSILRVKDRKLRTKFQRILEVEMKVLM